MLLPHAWHDADFRAGRSVLAAAGLTHDDLPAATVNGSALARATPGTVGAALGLTYRAGGRPVDLVVVGPAGWPPPSAARPRAPAGGGEVFFGACRCPLVWGGRFLSYRGVILPWSGPGVGVSVVRTVQAYRFALDLAPVQVRQVVMFAGAGRLAYNVMLARVVAVTGQRTAERSYGIPDECLTPALGWSLPALRKTWNQVKGEVAPWWRECSKEAFNTGLDALASALKNWSESRAGKRAGRPVGFPRFKAKHRSVPVVRFTTGAIRVEPDRKHVVLPRLGRLKLHESARKLARRVEAGTARILSATVRCTGGRWFVSFTVEVDRADRTPTRPGSVVGVDVGIRNLAVLSTGELVPNPRHLDAAQARLRTLGRAMARKQGPDRRAGRRSSNRWRRAAARLGGAHARVANLRRDGLHKLTTSLAREHGTVVVEDLNVAGMLGNRRLARHVADAGFAELRRLLGYKTVWNGSRLVVADRWFPSSKTCSACGVVKAKLALAERTYRCATCGLVLDRDVNAARNLAALATTATAAPECGTAGSGPVAGRGANRKTPHLGQEAEKRQPGTTATVGRTGTVPP